MRKNVLRKKGQLVILAACGAVVCNDREMGVYTRAVSGQRYGKHVPAATDMRNNRTSFSVWSVLRCYKQGTRLELSSVQEAVKRGIAIVGTVTGNM
jgi:hypothetical protein